MTLRGGKGPRRGADLSNLGVIADGAILIRNGILEEVGPSRRVENLAAARQAVEINAAGKLVLPGFIDSHTHLIFPPPAAPGTDRLAAIRAISDQTASRLAMRARALIESMARHGTTTVEVKTGCGLEENAETKLLKILEGLRKDPLDVVSSFFLTLPEEAADEAFLDGAAQWVANEFLPKIRRRKLAAFADIAWTGALVRQSRFRAVLEGARRLGFACRVHADEKEPAEAIRLAVDQQALSIDHLEHAVAPDAAIFNGSGTMATLLPTSSFLHGDGAPARTLVDSGVPLVLGSNYNPQFNPTLSMQTVIAMACLRMGLTAAEAITAATINAAHALGIAGQVGSLETGKRADVVILNARDYRDLATNLGVNLVHTTIKDGVPIYREADVGGHKPRVPVEFVN